MADVLEVSNLGVLEGGCQGNHARHVFATVGEVVTGQAESKSRQKAHGSFRV